MTLYLAIAKMHRIRLNRLLLLIVDFGTDVSIPKRLVARGDLGC